MWRKASGESGAALQPSPPALDSFPQPKMAAVVDFGDLELFEAFDPQEESTPKPVHTRFKDDEEEEDDDEDENGVGDAELQEQLRRCEETIEQLRAENILPACWALSPGTCGLGGGRRGRGGNSKGISILSHFFRGRAGWRAGVSVRLQKLQPRPAGKTVPCGNPPVQTSLAPQPRAALLNSSRTLTFVTLQTLLPRSLRSPRFLYWRAKLK